MVIDKAMIIQIVKALQTLFIQKVKRLQWKKSNRHNYTTIGKTNFSECVTVGNFTYGRIDPHLSNSNYKLKIGSFCSIADNVVFIVSSDHPLNYLSTYPIKTKLMNIDNPDAISKGDIIVDDDVWIGYGAIILSGVQIGQGAVVAAGAVVTETYAIVGGVPAKIIKYRFNKNVIEKLLKIDYSKITKEMIQQHVDDFYQPITNPKQLDWMPQKTISV